MPPRPRTPRRRLTFLWFVLAGITALAGFAVHHLYHSLRRELAAQSQLASATARAEALRDLEALADAARQETFTALLSLHFDGLSSQLRRWDEAHPEILATFQWDKSRGLTFVSSLENAPALAAPLDSLWPALRRWRQLNPEALARFEHAPDAWHSEAHATLNNPRFTTGLGYQSENLEQLAYEKLRIDPWVGVAADPARPQAPWIFWYQPGPDTPVRGCLLDPRPLIARCEARLRDHTLATLRLVPGSGLALLPGHSLLVAPGELFASKQTTALLAALALALLLALVLLAALTLTYVTRRATLEAERKTTFVAQVSHELRTPLTSIQMFADMLHAPDLAELKRQKYAGHISRETSRLRSMVERLLSFSSLQQNKFRPTLEEFDLHALVQETLDETSTLLAQAGLFPELRLPAGPQPLHTDRAALKQALLNLLENAAKYAPNSGALVLSAETSPKEIHLRVSDEGPGISAALRDTLFEPFVQGDQTLVGKKPGLGLGLSIARGQLRACGADLVLVPSARGATFEIRLKI